MKKLENFVELGLNVTWKLIDIGFKGEENNKFTFYFKNNLSAKNVIDYAISLMQKCKNIDDNIFELACENEKNEYEVNNYVKKLAQNENTEYDVELKKWQILYILNHLPDADKAEIDFGRGLVELTEIWVSLACPSNFPNIFQGVNNDLAPEEYYSPGNYEKFRCELVEWISDEIQRIKSL